jgi:hypothetical protein
MQDASPNLRSKSGAFAPFRLKLVFAKMKKWKLVIPIAAVAVFLAWYAFRPERLVVNRYGANDSA